jgi:rhodanese-related sulfurtransferase
VYWACGGQSPRPVTTSAPAAKAEVEGGSYTNVTPQQLAEMLKKKDFFFVNVHIPYEGEIEPTDAQIPYDQTAQQLSQYPADKSAKIVLYCRSGRMSSIAAKELVKAGFTNVWNLDGGMAAWEQQGLPLKER